MKVITETSVNEAIVHYETECHSNEDFSLKSLVKENDREKFDSPGRLEFSVSVDENFSACHTVIFFSLSSKGFCSVQQILSSSCHVIYGIIKISEVS